ncbi:HPr kinase/phosphorylase [Shinella pollutisoli]|uniref:HPr kinase/phosphorylase n=1 Tax=Shinella pollutisoli TaxID=2250594 RepID=A0ABV7DGQ2_9HYPH|nr:HPr kinase/phosphorylase [Shinella pollutisoli]
MTPVPANVHGTAIVVGTTGLLFIGRSGAGKSAVALHCLEQARLRGLFSALVSDDQVLISIEGGRAVARAPRTIAGLLEVRGAGVVRMPAIEAAVLGRAVAPLAPPFTERLPPEEETAEVLPQLFLPLTRLPLFPGCCAFSTLVAIHPEILRGWRSKAREKAKSAI